MSALNVMEDGMTFSRFYHVVAFKENCGYAVGQSGKIIKMPRVFRLDLSILLRAQLLQPLKILGVPTMWNVVFAIWNHYTHFFLNGYVVHFNLLKLCKFLS